jgi:hypothetical protein
MKLMQRGAEARHVGETRLNRESSRSHSVFTCTVERHAKSDNGLTNILFSRLNLIDLAGMQTVHFVVLFSCRCSVSWVDHSQTSCCTGQSFDYFLPSAMVALNAFFVSSN